MSAFFDAHKATLDKALETARSRDYWTAYPENPSPRVYGETAQQDGEAAFQARLNAPFALAGHPGTDPAAGAGVGKEQSPYGFPLGISYPRVTPDQAIAAAEIAQRGWAAASVEERVGVCLEMLHRINKRSFEVAQAVMHTSGQGPMMAFQAGGPHAQDRGLEAVTYAYAEMTRTPGTAVWTKPQGKHDPIVLDKSFRIVPRGLALLIGCNTFPTWNSYPALFASMATGNAVIVKPHPAAIAPLAVTLEIGRQVLAEAGFDPNVLVLAADERGAELTKELALRPEIRIVDFTGSNAFGRWLRENVGPDTQVYTEEAGVNSVVVGSTDSFKGMCANIAFSLSLYSGQMCTAPQDIFVPAGGIESDEGHKSVDEVAQGIGKAIDKLLGDPARAAAIGGAIANPATLERVKNAVSLGKVVRASGPIEGQEKANTATPLLLQVDSATSEAHREENFGPIAFVVSTEDIDAAIAEAAALAKQKGAITASVYATDEAVLDRAADAFADAGVPLSCNLTGHVYVNQSAAFSDFHVTGANPAGNACLTDAAFVANRFRVVAIRRPKAA